MSREVFCSYVIFKILLLDTPKYMIIIIEWHMYSQAQERNAKRMMKKHAMYMIKP